MRPEFTCEWNVSLRLSFSIWIFEIHFRPYLNVELQAAVLQRVDVLMCWFETRPQIMDIYLCIGQLADPKWTVHLLDKWYLAGWSHRGLLSVLSTHADEALVTPAASLLYNQPVKCHPGWGT